MRESVLARLIYQSTTFLQVCLGIIPEKNIILDNEACGEFPENSMQLHSEKFSSSLKRGLFVLALYLAAPTDSLITQRDVHVYVQCICTMYMYNEYVYVHDVYAWHDYLCLSLLAFL